MFLGLNNVVYFNNNDKPGSSIQIHELTHASLPEMQKKLISKHVSLKNGVYPSSYRDDPDEIYSRLMEFRYSNKLNPKKKYTIEEIRKMSDFGDGGNSGWENNLRPLDLLERYDDKSLLWMINDLTDNQTSQNYEKTYT